jgi:DNA replication protein DnaC
MESVSEILSNNLEVKSPMSTKDSSKNNGGSGDNPGHGRKDCPICGGLGYVVPDVEPTDPSFGRAVPCECRESDIEREKFQRLLKLSQLGALEGCTFKSFISEGIGLTDAKQRNLSMAYERALAYAQNPTGWLVFKGGYGCGKTHLAAAIANHRLNLGHAVLFINTPDLLDHLRGAFSPNADTSYDERFEQVRNAPLLVLDDLGAQSNTPWAQEKLYQILNHRYNAQLSTIITTNEELEAIDIRVRSRLADDRICTVIHITAPDFRMGGVAQDQSDLSSLHLHEDKTFESFDLRQGELPQQEADNLLLAYETALEYAQSPRDWLVLNSIAYGNGKTHLAAAIANYVNKTGEPVLFVVVPDFLDYLKATFNPTTNARLDRRFDEVKKSPLLILDDLGTESATAWAREKLYQLFNYRYSARLATVITTATPMKELDRKLEARMLDGNRRSTFVVIKAPSYRGRIQSSRRR